MQKFRALFEAYGADYDATMERFMKNETLYLRLLDMLFQDTNLQKLGDALDAGDLKSAFEAAHTLKGVVGNMGLTPLYNAVCALVEPLRAGNACDYMGMYQVLQSEFYTVDELRTRLKEAE